MEGAEDDAGGGAGDSRGCPRRDVVVGITASGRTPLCGARWGRAKERGAKTILLALIRYLRFSAGAADGGDYTEAGAEVLTGSTRLKAGTATKLILNILTTLAMARTGKVRAT